MILSFAGLQNHDVQVKTNEEAVQILKWLDGASDVEVEFWQKFTLTKIKELQRNTIGHSRPCICSEMVKLLKIKINNEK